MNDPDPQWFNLDVCIFRRPIAAAPVGRVRLGDGLVPCFEPSSFTRENLFDSSLEKVLESIGSHSRNDVEPDGYFVRSGESSGRFWRLNGQLFDLNERLWRVELRGECPGDALEEILLTLGWPQTQIVFQLNRHGVTIDEADFRRWAALPQTPRSGRPPNQQSYAKQDRNPGRAES